MDMTNFPVRKVLRWLIYIGSFAIPLFFLPFTADYLDFNKSSLLFFISGISLVLFLVDMIKDGKLTYRSSSFYVPIILFVVAAAISVAASSDRFTSIFGIGNGQSFSLVSLISIGIFFFLARNVIEDKGEIMKSLLTSSLGLVFLVSALQMIGVVVIPGIFGKPSFTLIGSINALGFLAATSLPLFWATPETEIIWKKTIINILRVLGFVSSLFILVVLNWGYLWIAAFIGVLAYIAFTSSQEIKQGKMKFYVKPMVIIVLGIFLWIINFQWTEIRNKLPVEVSPTHASSYAVALDSLKMKPLGFGLENYVIAYDKLRPAGSVNNILFQTRFIDSTSEVTTMAAEGGLPMLLAFLAFLVILVRELYKNIQNRFYGNSNNGKIWASIVALIIVFFFYPITFAHIFVLFALLAIGVLRGSGNVPTRELNLEERGLYSLLGSVGFIVGLVCVLVSSYFMVNRFISNVEIANAAGAKNKDKAISLYVKSINSYVHDTRTYRLLTQALLEQIANDINNGPGERSSAEYSAQLQNRVASVINVAVRSTEINPADSENWMNRGYVYQNLISLVNGSDEAAINMYGEALSRSPANALAHVRVGNIHLTLSDTARKTNNYEIINTNLDKAEKEYMKAIELYNNYGQALYNLAAVYDRKGELPQAIRQFERLRSTNPNDPSIPFQLGLLYYRNNQKDMAFSAWEQAVLLFPDYSNARWYLSLIYEERNDLKHALAEVEAIQKLNPDNDLVEKRIEDLKNGIRQIVPPEDVLDKSPLNNEQ